SWTPRPRRWPTRSGTRTSSSHRSASGGPRSSSGSTRGSGCRGASRSWTPISPSRSRRPSARRCGASGIAWHRGPPAPSRLPARTRRGDRPYRGAACLPPPCARLRPASRSRAHGGGGEASGPVPLLILRAGAGPYLELRAVRGVPVRHVQALVRLRVHQIVFASVDPLLGSGAVARPQLHLRSVDGRAGGDVEALAE